MNEITQIEIPPTSNALATIETTNFALVFVPGGVDLILERIKRDARAEAAKLDISTPKNREAILALKRKVVRSRTTLDAAGKDLKAEWLAKSNAIDADRRKARAELEALEQEIEAPVVAYQKIEDDRRKANEDAIATMDLLVVGLADLSPAEIKERSQQLAIVAEFNYSAEFVALAERAQAGVFAQLEMAHQAAVRREEAEAKAELERLAEIERQRLAEIQAQKERDAEIAREAAERAKREAEAEAERKAQAERDAVARREREAAEALAKSQREAQEAQERQQKAEADRIAAEQRAEREKQEAAERAEQDRIAAVEAERRRAEQAAQRADYHRRMLQHVKDCGFGFIDGQPQAAGILQRELTTKITFDEENFGDLLSEALAAKDEALGRIQRAIDEGNRRRAEEETEAERKRAAEAERVATEKRAANRAHQAKINGEALAGLMATGLTEEQGKAVIVAVATGKIKHITIGY